MTRRGVSRVRKSRSLDSLSNASPVIPRDPLASLAPWAKVGTYRAIFARVSRTKHSRHAGGRRLYRITISSDLLRYTLKQYPTIQVWTGFSAIWESFRIFLRFAEIPDYTWFLADLRNIGEFNLSTKGQIRLQWRQEIVVYVMLAISPFRVREITNLTTTTLQNITTKFWV